MTTKLLGSVKKKKELAKISIRKRFSLLNRIRRKGVATAHV